MVPFRNDTLTFRSHRGNFGIRFPLTLKTENQNLHLDLSHQLFYGLQRHQYEVHAIRIEPMIRTNSLSVYKLIFAVRKIRMINDHVHKLVYDSSSLILNLKFYCSSTEVYSNVKYNVTKQTRNSMVFVNNNRYLQMWLNLSHGTMLSILQ